MATPNNPDVVIMQNMLQDSAKMVENFTKQAKSAQSNISNMQPIANAFGEMAQSMMKDPQKLLEMQFGLMQSQMQLWNNMVETMMGKTPEPIASPKKGDRRFNSEKWDENFAFNFMKQSYLLTYEWMLDMVKSLDNVDDETRKKLDFYTRQFLDAMSPTNFPLTNPEVMELTMKSGGQNLRDGLKNMLEDMQRGNGELKISMTDYDAFEVGKNIAVTEGSVVYRCDMFELIQYKPKGEKVYSKPLLIFPPWINRYYILDLTPENSFIKYAVEECGLNVFLVSWKNPDETYRDTGWEDYLQKGLFKAVDKTLEITGEKDLNAIGYCIGGTLLTSALAVMAKKKDKRINSATFFTTLMDFSKAGELGVFIDEEQVANIEASMAQKGYLDGAEMAKTFSMLRANDLIWSFVVNNYLMGKDPFPFDILYWNDDPTRLPAAMHSYYLRNMYLENNLVKKDKLQLCGEKVDISQIDQDIYMVTGKNDHITEWDACFAPMHKLKSNVRFILGKAGHVAGVVNPPAKKKGLFWAGEVTSADSTEWQKSAKESQGSWWPDWKEWIAKHSGEQVSAPAKLGSTKHKPLCEAPGEYVKEK